MKVFILFFSGISISLTMFYILSLNRHLKIAGKALKELANLYKAEKHKNQELLNTYWAEHKRVF